MTAAKQLDLDQFEGTLSGPSGYNNAKLILAECKRLLAERAELVRVVERCQAALRANGAPNCEAMKESAEVLRKLGAE